MHSNAPKGKLQMSLFSKRLVSIAASTLILSLVSASVNAQTPVLIGTGINNGTKDVRTGPVTSTFTFTSSMILNSLGFVTSTYSSANVFEYSFDGGTYTPVSLSALTVTDGFGWLDISPVTMNQGQYVTIRTVGTNPSIATTPTLNFGSVAAGSNVTFSNNNANHFQFANTPNNPDLWSNGNIKVSNPGSNVAPEPGSFALALTGGAALLGICVRRRRNAG
jgi:hypothetical protein